MGVAEQQQLIRAYAQATLTLKDRIIQLISSLFVGLGSYRDADMELWVARVTPVVTGATAAMATMTDAYLTAVITDMAATSAAAAGTAAPVAATPPVPIRPVYPRPTPVAQVYQRPIVATRVSLSKGRTFTEAVEAGRARAVELATTDLQMAKRDASRARLAADSKVVGYRRVLTGSKSCAMCVLAARQRYHKERLMPIHPGCSCSVAPIIGTSDPGQDITAQRARDAEAAAAGELEDVEGADDLHALIAKQFGGEARSYRGKGYGDLVVEHEHGEIGPVMARRGDRWTSDPT